MDTVLTNMNNRQLMRASNSKAVKYLLKNGFSNIWLKNHTRYNDWVYCSGYKYQAKDLWRLFDGACWKGNKLYFLQIATGYFHKSEPMAKFLDGTGIICLNINVSPKGVKIIYVDSNLINTEDEP